MKGAIVHDRRAAPGARARRRRMRPGRCRVGYNGHTNRFRKTGRFADEGFLHGREIAQNPFLDGAVRRDRREADGCPCRPPSCLRSPFARAMVKPHSAPRNDFAAGKSTLMTDGEFEDFWALLAARGTAVLAEQMNGSSPGAPRSPGEAAWREDGGARGRPSKPAQQRCGTCRGCTASDCGSCKNCRDKTKCASLPLLRLLACGPAAPDAPPRLDRLHCACSAPRAPRPLAVAPAERAGGAPSTTPLAPHY